MEKDWERFVSGEGATKKELRQPLRLAEFLCKKCVQNFVCL